MVERKLDLAVPQLVVSDARRAMNLLAAPFFGHPSRSLALAGVTGTNGKTTTTYLLDAIFAAARRSTGIIGTVETRFAGGSTRVAAPRPNRWTFSGCCGRWWRPGWASAPSR